MLIGCAVLTAGTLGAIFGACGVFYVPICTDLGFERNQIASWQQAHFLSMTFAMPVAAKVIEKFNIRIVMTTSAIACGIAAAAMGTYTEIWQWVASGVVYGTFGTCLMQLPQATILTNWFVKRTGLAMGLSTAVGSIGSAVFAMIFANIIIAVGWRPAYFIQGAIVLIASLPFTLFVFRLRPSDIGAKPYGASAAGTVFIRERTKDEIREQNAAPKRQYVPFKRGVLSVTFIMIFIFAGLAALIGSGFDAHLPGYAESIGFSAIFGASLVSALQLGSFCEKLLMGWANDKFGIENTVYIEFAVVALGMLGLVFCRSEIALLVAAFFFGVQDSFTSISLPLLIRRFFGNKDFTEYYAIARMGSGIFGSFGSRLVGLTFDRLGSFTPAFLIATGLCVVGAVIVTIARVCAKRLQWKEEPLVPADTKAQKEDSNDMPKKQSDD